MIMKTVEKLLKQKGCPKINLQVRKSNKDVIMFYNSIGYSDDQVISLGKRLVEDQGQTGQHSFNTDLVTSQPVRRGVVRIAKDYNLYRTY